MLRLFEVGPLNPTPSALLWAALDGNLDLAWWARPAAILDGLLYRACRCLDVPAPTPHLRFAPVFASGVGLQPHAVLRLQPRIGLLDDRDTGRCVAHPPWPSVVLAAPTLWAPSPRQSSRLFGARSNRVSLSSRLCVKALLHPLARHRSPRFRSGGPAPGSCPRAHEVREQGHPPWLVFGARRHALPRLVVLLVRHKLRLRPSAEDGAGRGSKLSSPALSLLACSFKTRWPSLELPDDIEPVNGLCHMLFAAIAIAIHP